MKRAQTSIEFLLLVSFGGLIFIVFFALIQERILEARFEQLNRDLDDVAEVVISEVRLAERFGDGYFREFYLPPNLRGAPYNITVSNTDVVLRSLDATYLYFFNTPLKGTFNPGLNNITYVAGQIYINFHDDKIYKIVIDGDDSDWQAMKSGRGVVPIPDIRSDSYTELSNNLNPYDLKSLTIFNDNDFLYLRIELYEPNIKDFGINTPETNFYDLVIFFDTDLDSTTGYQSDNFSEFILTQGADYLIFDNGLHYYDSRRLIYSTLGSNRLPSEYNQVSGDLWDWNTGNIGPNYRYNFTSLYTLEMEIPLSSLGNPAVQPGDSLGYTLISKALKPNPLRHNADYIPGEFDDFSGGVITLR